MSKGLKKRFAAAVRAYGDPGTMVARCLVSPSLNKGPEGEAGLRKIIEAARGLARINDCPVVLVVIDTKARATAGDDENSAADVSVYIEHRAKAISEATGAAVLTVHHTGKDAARGPRGSGALPAGDDFRFEAHNSTLVKTSRC